MAYGPGDSLYDLQTKLFTASAGEIYLLARQPRKTPSPPDALDILAGVDRVRALGFDNYLPDEPPQSQSEVVPVHE